MQPPGKMGISFTFADLACVCRRRLCRCARSDPRVSRRALEERGRWRAACTIIACTVCDRWFRGHAGEVFLSFRGERYDRPVEHAVMIFICIFESLVATVYNGASARRGQARQSPNVNDSFTELAGHLSVFTFGPVRSFLPRTPQRLAVEACQSAGGPFPNTRGLSRGMADPGGRHPQDDHSYVPIVRQRGLILFSFSPPTLTRIDVLGRTADLR